MAAQASPLPFAPDRALHGKSIMTTGPNGERYPLRFDPDGAPIGPEIPDELIQRWRNMLAHCGAAQARQHKSYERFFKDQEACIRVMRRLLGDATGIAEDLSILSDLFAEAIDSQGVSGKLAEALRLVQTSMASIAGRLENLEIQGDAACERHHQ